MTKTKESRKPRRTSRGLLARPLDSLVFLLPMLVFYEIASVRQQDRVIAFDLLRQTFEAFGGAAIVAPGFVVVVILLATHFFSGEKWVVHWKRVLWMFPEAFALSLPLLLLNRVTTLSAFGGDFWQTADPIAIGIGAGIYEELVFRLGFISLIVIIGLDLLRIDADLVAGFAWLVSSVAFALHHHPPIGVEPFSAVRFVFRTLAGFYLALVFWFRGYGSAAGAHAAYNSILVLFND